MCGLFVCARVREARKRGWGISNFLGFLGNLSVAEDFFNFLGFQKGCRSLLTLFKLKYILKNVYYS